MTTQNTSNLTDEQLNELEQLIGSIDPTGQVFVETKEIIKEIKDTRGGTTKVKNK